MSFPQRRRGKKSRVVDAAVLYNERKAEVDRLLSILASSSSSKRNGKDDSEATDTAELSSSSPSSSSPSSLSSLSHFQRVMSRKIHRRPSATNNPFILQNRSAVTKNKNQKDALREAILESVSENAHSGGRGGSSVSVAKKQRQALANAAAGLASFKNFPKSEQRKRKLLLKKRKASLARRNRFRNNSRLGVSCAKHRRCIRRLHKLRKGAPKLVIVDFIYQIKDGAQHQKLQSSNTNGRQDQHVSLALREALAKLSVSTRLLPSHSVLAKTFHYDMPVISSTSAHKRIKIKNKIRKARSRLGVLSSSKSRTYAIDPSLFLNTVGFSKTPFSSPSSPILVVPLSIPQRRQMKQRQKLLRAALKQRVVNVEEEEDDAASGDGALLKSNLTAGAGDPSALTTGNNTGVIFDASHALVLQLHILHHNDNENNTDTDVSSGSSDYCAWFRKCLLPLLGGKATQNCRGADPEGNGKDEKDNKNTCQEVEEETAVVGHFDGLHPFAFLAVPAKAIEQEESSKRERIRVVGKSKKDTNADQPACCPSQNNKPSHALLLVMPPTAEIVQIAEQLKGIADENNSPAAVTSDSSSSSPSPYSSSNAPSALKLVKVTCCSSWATTSALSSFSVQTISSATKSVSKDSMIIVTDVSIFEVTESTAPSTPPQVLVGTVEKARDNSRFSSSANVFTIYDDYNTKDKGPTSRFSSDLGLISVSLASSTNATSSPSSVVLARTESVVFGTTNSPRHPLLVLRGDNESLAGTPLLSSYCSSVISRQWHVVITHTTAQQVLGIGRNSSNSSPLHQQLGKKRERAAGFGGSKGGNNNNNKDEESLLFNDNTSKHDEEGDDDDDKHQETKFTLVEDTRKRTAKAMAATGVVTCDGSGKDNKRLDARTTTTIIRTLAPPPSSATTAATTREKGKSTSTSFSSTSTPLANMCTLGLSVAHVGAIGKALHEGHFKAARAMFRSLTGISCFSSYSSSPSRKDANKRHQSSSSISSSSSPKMRNNRRAMGAAERSELFLQLSSQNTSRGAYVCADLIGRLSSVLEPPLALPLALPTPEKTHDNDLALKKKKNNAPLTVTTAASKKTFLNCVHTPLSAVLERVRSLFLELMTTFHYIRPTHSKRHPSGSRFAKFLPSTQAAALHQNNNIDIIRGGSNAGSPPIEQYNKSNNNDNDNDDVSSSSSNKVVSSSSSSFSGSNSSGNNTLPTSRGGRRKNTIADRVFKNRAKQIDSARPLSTAVTVSGKGAVAASGGGGSTQKKQKSKNKVGTKTKIKNKNLFDFIAGMRRIIAMTDSTSRGAGSFKSPSFYACTKTIAARSGGSSVQPVWTRWHRVLKESLSASRYYSKLRLKKKSKARGKTKVHSSSSNRKTKKTCDVRTQVALSVFSPEVVLETKRVVRQIKDFVGSLLGFTRKLSMCSSGPYCITIAIRGKGAKKHALVGAVVYGHQQQQENTRNTLLAPVGIIFSSGYSHIRGCFVASMLSTRGREDLVQYLNKINKKIGSTVADEEIEDDFSHQSDDDNHSNSFEEYSTASTATNLLYVSASKALDMATSWAEVNRNEDFVVAELL